jgi:hypothetical protein
MRRVPIQRQAGMLALTRRHREARWPLRPLRKLHRFKFFLDFWGWLKIEPNQRVKVPLEGRRLCRKSASEWAKLVAWRRGRFLLEHLDGL